MSVKSSPELLVVQGDAALVSGLLSLTAADDARIADVTSDFRCVATHATNTSDVGVLVAACGAGVINIKSIDPSSGHTKAGDDNEISFCVFRDISVPGQEKNYP